MLISRFKPRNWTINTPLFLFYLKLGLVCWEIYRFFEYTPVKCFNDSLQSAVDARLLGGNPNWGVVAETRKMLASKSYGYQNIDPSHHCVIKCLNDEKTHAAVNTKFFNRLVYINEIYFMKWNWWSPRFKMKSPSLYVFLSYSMLNSECWSSPITVFNKFSRYSEMGMDTDHLFWAFAEKDLYNCNRAEKKAKGKSRNCCEAKTVSIPSL